MFTYIHVRIWSKSLKLIIFKKNNKSNLVVLCEKHHNEVHNNVLKIHGYEKTLKGGTKLKYEKTLPKSIKRPKKYSEYVDYIQTTYKEDYNTGNMKLKDIKTAIKLNKHISIGEQTLKKIISGVY